MLAAADRPQLIRIVFYVQHRLCLICALNILLAYLLTM